MAEEIEIGIIGAGWWACLAQIPALLRNPHVSTVAIARPDADNLQRAATHFGLPHAYTDNERMLRERPLAGVIVSSPHVLHAEHAQLAIQHGLHVMVEKPLCTNAADARELVAAARARGVELMLPLGWNFKPITEVAQRIMAAGRIGQVRHVVAQMASPLADLFAGQPMVETADHLFRPPPSTWADPSKAGGYGWGQLTHGLGALFRLIDLDPVRVFAKTGLSAAGVDYYDAAVVELGNGATVSLSGSATVPKSRGYQVDIRIFGSEGMLLFDLERARVELVRDDGETQVEALSADAGSYDANSALDAFVDLCRGAPTVNAADATVGLRSIAVLDAMYRSARSGRMEDC